MFAPIVECKNFYVVFQSDQVLGLDQRISGYLVVSLFAHLLYRLCKQMQLIKQEISTFYLRL